MDSNNNNMQICPWCQTEIVWDPEIGPEETCPHCLNELGGYRSIKLNLKQADDELPEEEDESVSDDDLDIDGLEDSLEDELLDDYTVEGERDLFAEKVIEVMDTQTIAPECSNCHELMLHAGERRVGASEFQPKVPEALGAAFVKAPYVLNVFVCPSCFKTDEYLSKEDQQALLQAFAPEED